MAPELELLEFLLAAVALSSVREGVASALEFCYSPEIQLEHWPAIGEWEHLTGAAGK